jgi:hypothetical protein
VRELVYLSEAKLRQFQDDRRGWFSRVKEAGFKGPFGIGEAKIALSEGDTDRRPSLSRVLRNLEKSGRAPRWFEEDDITPGEWVSFEARLCFEVFQPRGGQSAGLVIFVQPQDDEGVPRRLLLHGASQHVISINSPRSGVEITHEQAMSLPVIRLLVIRAQRALDELDGRTEREFPDHYGPNERSIVTLDSRIAHNADQNAARMAGIARVSGIITFGPKRLVVASPLYVEYASKPTEESLGDARKHQRLNFGRATDRSRKDNVGQSEQ